MSKKIYIFDTTLRDGEQSPGVSLNIREKLEIANQLKKLNVDIIEAGFPIASPGDFEAVKAIADSVQGPTIAALARISKGDIDRAWEAIKNAKKPRIHTFIATSDIHMQYKLRKSPEEVLALAVAGVRHAKSYTDDVEFSGEDGSRSDLNFLCKVVEAVIDAGATTVNIPDTVGYATPQEFGEFIRQIKLRVPNISKAKISIHCHNDLGMAVANTLAAIENGAEQVECAMNGIGERAGNTSLEEIVMALHTRKDWYNAHTDIVTTEIYRTSKMVSSFTGMLIQPNKAIVGKNAFTHESGIHQDGVLKERTTYEIMNPLMVGIVQNNIVLGKHSGRHAFKERLTELGYILADEEIDKAFAKFKNLADKKKEIVDNDIAAIIEEDIRVITHKWDLVYLHISSGTTITPTATVRIASGDELLEEVACGDGPIDAAFKAIDKLVEIHPTLQNYALNAVTGGKDALGEVTVRVEYGDKVYVGRGISTDVIEASAKAYLNAINKIIFDKEGRS